MTIPLGTDRRIASEGPSGASLLSGYSGTGQIFLSGSVKNPVISSVYTTFANPTTSTAAISSVYSTVVA